MDAWYFLLQAERLVENGRSGATLVPGAGGLAADMRTAVSRAYYAAHLTARAFLVELGYKVASAGDSHTTVPRALDKTGDPDLAQAASDLGSLATERRYADYDLNNAGVENVGTTTHSVALAKSIIGFVQAAARRAKSDPAYRARVIAAIDAWRARDTVRGLSKK